MQYEDIYKSSETESMTQHVCLPMLLMAVVLFKVVLYTVHVMGPALMPLLEVAFLNMMQDTELFLKFGYILKRGTCSHNFIL